MLNSKRLIKVIRFSLLVAVMAFGRPAAAIAQDEVQVLVGKMQKSTGREKADLLNQVSLAYRNTDRLKSLEYARLAYKTSSELTYTAGQALALKNQGISWFFIGNNDSATYCYKEALAGFVRIGDMKGISACYNNLGLIAQETGKYPEALRFYERSADMDRKLGDEIGVAQTTQNMADIYIYQGEYQKALALTNACLKIYTVQSDKSGIMGSLLNRAAVYDYLALYQESLRDYQHALRLSREINDKYTEIRLNSNLGVMYWHWQKPDIAMQYLTTALEMSDENDDAYNIDNTLKTMAEIYTSRKEYARANDIYQKILNRNVKLDNKRQVAVIMTAIGRNLIELNEVDKALGYLNKSLEITTGLNTPYEKLENYRNLVIVNAILHNFRAADSLQDVFATTRAFLMDRDSLAANNKQNITGSNVDNCSMPIALKWAMSFLLILAVIAISVVAFRNSKV